MIDDVYVKGFIDSMDVVCTMDTGTTETGGGPQIRKVTLADDYKLKPIVEAIIDVSDLYDNDNELLSEVDPLVVTESVHGADISVTFDNHPPDFMSKHQDKSKSTISCSSGEFLTITDPDSNQADTIFTQGAVTFPDDLKSTIDSNFEYRTASSTNHAIFLLSLIWLINLMSKCLCWYIAFQYLNSSTISLEGTDVLPDNDKCGFIVQYYIAHRAYQRTRREIGEEDARFRPKNAN